MSRRWAQFDLGSASPRVARPSRTVGSKRAGVPPRRCRPRGRVAGARDRPAAARPGLQRVGRRRAAGLVAPFQQARDLVVEDLLGDAARLVEDDPAQLGVGVELEVLALVEEAPAVDVDQHAVRIREPVGLVGELAVAVRRRLGVDGRGLPVLHLRQAGRHHPERAGGVGWQIFDAKVTHLLEGRYQTGTPVVADSLEALVDKLPLDRVACRRALDAYNAAVTPGRFDPTVRDGPATRGRPCPSPTGPSASTPRPSPRIRSPVASPSPSAGCASPIARRW